MLLKWFTKSGKFPDVVCVCWGRGGGRANTMMKRRVDANAA
ncbi:unnamed protein product [Spirodela intermedia]|uniref:Uncharacterized protein n=1 Tax=Spirodela intermedia TaxID=51605 RepID=A0A7I8K2T6_SPIIN|nr:unnamed protein product [Spirodela intermedia]